MLESADLSKRASLLDNLDDGLDERDDCHSNGVL